MTSNVIPVDRWLIRTIAASILGGLAAIGAYMISWNAQDTGFKREVLTRLADQDNDLMDIKHSLQVVPTNTQKINDLERRVSNLESDK